jgi:hypothetical protein
VKRNEPGCHRLEKDSHRRSSDIPCNLEYFKVGYSVKVTVLLECDVTMLFGE